MMETCLLYTSILAAPGFEEIELMAPLDILRRLNFDVQLAGVQSDKVVSTHDVDVYKRQEFPKARQSSPCYKRCYWKP